MMRLFCPKALAFICAASVHATAAHAEGRFTFAFAENLPSVVSGGYAEADLNWKTNFAVDWRPRFPSLATKAAPQGELGFPFLQSLLNLARNAGTKQPDPIDLYDTTGDTGLGFGFRFGMDF